MSSPPRPHWGFAFPGVPTHSQPGKHPSQSGSQLGYASLPAEGAKSISKIELHDTVVGVCSKMCLYVMQHHEATLGSADPKLPVLQMWLQGAAVPRARASD